MAQSGGDGDGDGTSDVDLAADDRRRPPLAHDGKAVGGVLISEAGARQVLSQLLRRGYFHRGPQVGEGTCAEPAVVSGAGVDEVDDNDSGDDDLEAFRRWQTDIASRRPRSWDVDCQVIPTRSGDRYYTRGGLVAALVDGQLPAHGGRASIRDLCRPLDVDGGRYFVEGDSAHHLHLEVGPLWALLPPSVTVLRPAGGPAELVAGSYWERLRGEVAMRVAEEGTVQMSDLCCRYAVPRDVLISNVVAKLVGKDPPVATLVDDPMRLVSAAVCDGLRTAVVGYFATVTEPVRVSDVCSGREGWDLKQVLEWLHRACHPHGVLKGEVHVDAATTSHQSAIYLPTAHRIRQEQDVLRFAAANGYVTSAHRNGVTAARMTGMVLDAFPDATVLIEDDVIILDATFQQFQVGVQEYLSSSSSSSSLVSGASETLDLNDYLPSELIQPHIVPIMLEKIGFTPEQGVAVVVDDHAALVSKRFVQEVTENQLSRLIHEFAKTRAEQIFHTTTATTEESDHQMDEDESTAKSRKGASKAKSKRVGKDKSTHQKNRPSGESSRTAGEVPLSQVANTIVGDYPNFLGQDSATAISDSVPWEENDDEEGHRLGGRSGLLVSFCRQAFYTDKFRQQCEIAVHAELERLQSERDSKARLSRKDAAAKIRSVESSFEEAFAMLCYLIQAQVKFIAFASNLEEFGEESMEVLKAELLRGPCADLTSRITQHCLFQEEQDCLFSFLPPDNGDGERNGKQKDGNHHDANLPPYCFTVETAARSHPRSYLSCPPPREPLPVLRESFSGNSGIVLSRQWVLCGGECYLGGVRQAVDEDSNSDQHVRPGSLDGFLSHVESNCLTLCGLPFKKLDKKAEKSFLFSRKQQLTSLLVSSTASVGELDAVAILEYTVMILFQQVRNLVVSGSLLRGPILKALEGERKVPAPVAAVLQRLNEAIESSGNADNELLHLVTDCGLCRDIAKHDTTAIEEYLAKD